MKILHFSDIHAQRQGFPEIKKCCDFIIDTAAAEQLDLIIFSGDTFEHADIRLDSEVVKYVFEFFTKLADIAPVSAIIGTPSHDGKAIEVLNHVKARYSIHVTSEAPEQLFFNSGEFYSGPISEPSAIISCFPAPTKRWFRSDDTIQNDEQAIAKGISTIMASFGAVAAEYACIHILNAHWNCTGAFVSGIQTLTGVDIEVSRDQMALGNFDLGCLGHIHKAQAIDDHLFFAGSIQNNTWGEQDTKGFYIHEIERSEGDARPEYQRSRFIETPTKPMFDLSCDLTVGDAKDLDLVINKHSKEEYAGSKVRLTVKAFTDEVELFGFTGTKHFFDSVGAELTFQIIRMPRENVRSERIQDLEGLYPKIQETALILEEDIPAGIKEKAERLEAGDPEKLLEEIKAL